jgi:hypothetical protein
MQTRRATLKLISQADEDAHSDQMWRIGLEDE